MPNFTDLAVQKLPPGTYFARRPPAFGIRVGKNRRTWIVTKGKNRTKVTLGHYPEGQGLEVAAWARSHCDDLPILMLAKGDDTRAKVEALGLGADDYVLKNQAIEEIAARVRARLRRRVALPKLIAAFEDYELNLKAGLLRKRENTPAQLTEAEFRVLKALIDRPRENVRREDLFVAAHG